MNLDFRVFPIAVEAIPANELLVSGTTPGQQTGLGLMIDGQMIVGKTGGAPQIVSPGGQGDIGSVSNTGAIVVNSVKSIAFPSSVSAGDLLYAIGVNALDRLSHGNNGSTLRTVAGIPTWKHPINRTTQNSTYSVVINDDGSLIDVTTSTSNIVINLPASATVGSGFTVWVRKFDIGGNGLTTGLVNITPVAGDGIGGATAAAVVSLSAPRALIGLMATGANTTDAWEVIECSGDFQETTTTNTALAASGVNKQMCALTLTPGDWDISAVASGIPGGTIGTAFDAGIGTTSASFAGCVNGDTLLEAPFSSSTQSFISLPAVRANLASSTAYYLNVLATYTGGSPSCYARMSARRIR